MAKAKTSEKASQDLAYDETEVRPSVGTYFKATLQLARAWIRTHKLRTLLSFVFMAVVVAGVVWLLRPTAVELDHDAIVTRVNQELNIKGDGNPVILTVEDESKATQPFLEQAKNGDKVLLYYKAQKAVLFRPSEDRIVHQGSYTPPDAKVFVRKGTAELSKVEAVKQKLEGVAEIDIVSEDVSHKADYQGITLVSITDRYDEKLRELEALFGVKTIRLPSGESFPDADILIIVGN